MRSQGLSEILVPLDGSKAADRAIPVAGRIAARSGARLHLVAIRRPLLPLTEHVAPEFAVVTPDLESISHAVLENHLESHADDIGMFYHVPVAHEVIDGVGSIADDLVTYVGRHEIDLIVMRTHGRSAIGRLCIGSVGSTLVERAGVPCLLLRENYGEMVKQARHGWEFARIMVPLDGSEEAEMAIEQALALATPSLTEIQLLIVVPRQWVPDGGEEYAVPQTAQRANAEAYVNGMARRLEARGYRARGFTIANRNPAAAIAAFAEQHRIALVSIASHHRDRGNRLLFGSVIDALVHETDVPVLAQRVGMSAVGGKDLEEVTATRGLEQMEPAMT